MSQTLAVPVEFRARGAERVRTGKALGRVPMQEYRAGSTGPPPLATRV